MDQQHRDNRDRRYGGGGGGRGSQSDASRGSRRRRDRRSRWADGGLDSFRRAAVLLLQLLQIGLQIRHYLAQFDHDQVGGAAMIMYHYDVHVTPAGAAPEVSQPAADLSAVKAELFRLYAEYCFPAAAPVVAYDGQRSLLTPGLLPEGDFQVAVQGRVFNVTVKLVRQQQLAGAFAEKRDACGCEGGHIISPYKVTDANRIQEIILYRPGIYPTRNIRWR